MKGRGNGQTGVLLLLGMGQGGAGVPMARMREGTTAVFIWGTAVFMWGMKGGKISVSMSKRWIGIRKIN